ncbi:hypothetical protein [Bacteriovorax sp. BSW11_IV]|uniref:hypothetical protein n=1 Tax=Bacteriovorax sp. BSW11_IV TaxID=1353529 RepID=UPI000557D559|nr:hypothetical protein [Bacteriovorax sp. BSW11_IV]
MTSQVKICPIPDCEFQGTPQLLEHFHIKSRANGKVYKNKQCSSCVKRLRAKKKTKASMEKQLASIQEPTHKGSFLNYEIFLKSDDSSIIEDYNKSTSLNLTQSDFTRIKKAVLMLFQLEVNTESNNHSQTKH